jgi:spoIIIJ-associated protein
MGIVIGKRGETLDALQHLTSLAVNKGDKSFLKISLDAENYREKRNVALESLAQKLAAKAMRTGRNQTLEPMNAYERRIIHSALQDHETVTTYSVGQGVNRKVVIALNSRDNR